MKVKFYMCGAEPDRRVTSIPLGIGSLLANLPTSVEGSFVEDRAELMDCDLIGLSSNAWGLREAVDILERSDIPVVIGGQGTLWKGLTEYPFKHIVQGEGEIAFAQICAGIADDKQQVIRFKPLHNIDILAPPMRGRIRDEVFPVFTSRGCPFGCKFCTAKAHWQKVRWHSAEYVIDDIRAGLSNYPNMRRVYFLDDLFIANKYRFESIYRMWVNDPEINKLTATGFVRADVLTEDIARKLKDMGFGTIRFGAESGSDRVLEMLGKGSTVADYWRVVEICKKVGLVCTASFMHDIPGETPEEAQATLDFIEKSGIRVEGWYAFASWPGMPMYDGASPLEVDMRVRSA